MTSKQTIRRLLLPNKKFWTTLFLSVLVVLSICRCESASSHAQISAPRSSLKRTLPFVPRSLAVRGGASEELGSYLSTAYGVKVDDEEQQTAILGGTLTDALREARSQARLLVVYIPSSKPGHGKKGGSDRTAIKSLLSQEVSTVAEKKARKKVKSGSFILWAAKAGSAEASVSAKRLKVKPPKGEKRPTLMVVYPAQAIGAGGVPKVAPRVISQHHCNPPPNEENMAVWLNTLRKRHAKQYAAMQLEKKEMEYFKERQKGYASSVQSDVQRQEDEKRAEKERRAEEKAEKERLEQLKIRRKELKESLPDEPEQGAEGVMTIALRFTDGNSGRRRFTTDTPVSTVFNWVDGVFEMERETVILTTMNGQKTFNWDDDSDTILSDTGLGKMAGLRVSVKEAGDEEEEEDQEEEEEE